MMMPLSLFSLTVHTFFTGLAFILISQGQTSCIEGFIYIGEWLNYPSTIERAKLGGVRISIPVFDMATYIVSCDYKCIQRS